MPWSLLGILLAVCAVACAVGFYKFVYFLSIGYGFAVAFGGIAVFVMYLIAPTATPPVCRAIDYGKFCFERDKREKEAKKKQVIVKVKEVQLSCRIEQHDFETRVNHAKRFLGEGNKVKAVVRFKGREMAHQDLGREVIAKFEEACQGFGIAEKKPILEGRFMSIILSPVKPEKK